MKKRAGKFNIYKILSISLVVINLVMIGTYIFLVDASIVHASRDREAKSNATIMTTKLTDLEGKYLSLLSKLDLEFAESLGLVPPEARGYAVLGNDDELVSYLGHEER